MLCEAWFGFPVDALTLVPGVWPGMEPTGEISALVTNVFIRVRKRLWHTWSQKTVVLVQISKSSQLSREGERNQFSWFPCCAVVQVGILHWSRRCRLPQGGMRVGQPWNSEETKRSNCALLLVDIGEFQHLVPWPQNVHGARSLLMQLPCATCTRFVYGALCWNTHCVVLVCLTPGFPKRCSKGRAIKTLGKTRAWLTCGSEGTTVLFSIRQPQFHSLDSYPTEERAKQGAITGTFTWRMGGGFKNAPGPNSVGIPIVPM